MAQIDTTITIEEDGVLIIENDVRVTASVCGDGEVIIDDMQIIKFGASVKISEGHYHRPVLALIPFTDSSKPHLAALAEHAAELLMDDERFIEAAHEAVGDHADGLGDYLYEQARDRRMESEWEGA